MHRHLRLEWWEQRSAAATSNPGTVSSKCNKKPEDLTPEQRRALLNRKRYERRNRMIIVAQTKIEELQKQLDEDRQTVSSIPDEGSKDDDVILASQHQPTQASSTLVVRFLKMEASDVENLANDMERLA
ncbi:unnamed protein product [Didymodactylos carnosus]|uniref:Uncharacterized protein n=1 Tax=Didymodactylos carnosus TaxID=1234261 RepID=A0A8S2E5U6_9BILA|nr:unnamed protein product [Didymodactylos carnosus]CAF3830191.1 unnamed protein product [Didymodactylos carnosus]